ncbi:DUF1877 domain-containing protein [Streptomyces nondiastaticus]|uniref:DUF1877 domain-containing protein n=1 Tax=Streptomyces nondiastaticus TaxID=3154512 RepID=UPI0034429BA5
MALTQQLARVSPQYLARCRRTAEDSPGKAPGWDPPDRDTLDLGWALWGLARFFRRSGVDAVLTAALERSFSGDSADDAGFLDHPTVHDGFDGPPALLAPAAVSEICRVLGTADIDEVLELLPRDGEEAAKMCGFGGFSGDLAAYLRGHFTALRGFYADASARGLAVVAWVD